MAGALNSRREFLKATGAAVAIIRSGTFSASAATDSSRIALVIGNNAYPNAPLGNAINDAKAVSDLLTRAGFQVTLKTNVARDALQESAMAFGQAARSSDAKLVLFYYAGHGAQLDWRNYLIPVDAKVDIAADLPTQCLDLGVLLNDLSKAQRKVFVIILDACRDKPFGTTFQTMRKGLSEFDAPAGSLLAFSTAPGSVAADGLGANGLYTENLVRELSVKGVRLEDAFKRVRLAVRVASRGAQIPWESTSLESDVFLFPTGEKLSEAQLEEQFRRELETWNRIKGSKRPDDWVDYLRDYPSGRFTEIAQTRLNSLLSVQLASAAAPSVVASAAPLASTAAAPPGVSPAATASIPPISAPTLTAIEASATLPTGASASEPPPVLVAGTAFDLEIRAGLPVPVLMRPSENPFSAGSYPLGRRYSIGDEAVYESSPLVGLRGNRSTRTVRVTRISEDFEFVEINDAITVWDSMGNIRKASGGRIFDPPNQIVPAELQLGKQWTTRSRVSDGSTDWDTYTDYKIVSRERVKVPAGEFEAFKLEGHGRSAGIRWANRLTTRQLVVPGFNFAVKSEFLLEPEGVWASQSGDLIELVSCRQRRWSVA